MISLVMQHLKEQAVVDKVLVVLIPRLFPTFLKIFLVTLVEADLLEDLAIVEMI